MIRLFASIKTMSSITPPDIASAMKFMGWPVASSLMDKWASGSAWPMPAGVKLGTTSPGAHIDTTLVTVAWLKKFARAAIAYQSAINNALNVPAQKVLRARLAAAGWTSGNFSLGSTSLDAKTLDTVCQTNFVQFGSTNDTIDELYGAIGKGTFKVAVVGRVILTAAKKPVFNVDSLGVYFRDTYDFIDDGWISQPLGVWSKSRCLSKAETAAYYLEKANRTLNPAARLIPSLFSGFEAVNNGDVCAWRDASGKGGDYVIYSDVSWVTPATAMQVAL